MMKLGTVIHYLRKIQIIYIYIYHVTHPADTSIFSPEIANFAISNAHIVCILINIVTILMMPGKIATPRPS